MTWTQPICDRCWEERNPERLAVRITTEHRDVETCCHCGKLTRSGIYVRVDPRTVKHPRQEVT